MAPNDQRWWLTEDGVELDDRGRRRSAVPVGLRPAPHRVSGAPSARALNGRATSPRRWRARRSWVITRWGRGRRIRYSRHGKVLVADPGREFAFITDEGGRESTVWRYRFEPSGDGRTRVTESYEVQVDPSVGPHPRRPHQPDTRGCSKGMRTTLERLKEAAEAAYRRTPAPARARQGDTVMTTCFTATSGRRCDHDDRRHPGARLESLSTCLYCTAPSPSLSIPAPWLAPPSS